MSIPISAHSSAPSAPAPCLQPFLLPESLPSVQPLVCIHPLTHIKASQTSPLILNSSIHLKPELIRGIKGPFWLSPGVLPSPAGRAWLAAHSSYHRLQMPRIRRGRAKPGHCSSAAPRGCTNRSGDRADFVELAADGTVVDFIPGSCLSLSHLRCESQPPLIPWR